MLDNFRVVAVSGPGTEDYPILRVADCEVIGEPYSPGIKYVSLTLLTAEGHKSVKHTHCLEVIVK